MSHRMEFIDDIKGIIYD